MAQRNDITTRYPVTRQVWHLVSMLNLSTANVLRRAGLEDTLSDQDERGITAAEYFALCDAVFAEADRPEVSLEFATKLARGPFVPAVFAFSCSPTIAEGARRLAVFKPLVAPIRLECHAVDAGFQVIFNPIHPDLTFPASFAEFELLYFVELCRALSGSHIVPVAAMLPAAPLAADAITGFLGTTPQVGPATSVTLSRKDAELQLLSSDQQLWDLLEPKLRRDMETRATPPDATSRVRNALITLMPGGYTSLDAVAKHLGQSKRSLQRELSTEGQSFQTILAQTRQDLAEHYLANRDTTLDEISYLLGYRDPNSFFRAFHQWTGKTPGAVRRAS